MKFHFNRLHTQLGDLWWYSLMICVAYRSSDVIQAFIGLWLVPKYVRSEELGAVLPLQQLSGLFAIPLAIVATEFAKYVNTYATRGEYGKVKSFIHDVLLASIGIFLTCIASAYLVIPHFYERLNISAGLLTILILAAGFTGNIANLFTSALQGLKKFKTITIQNLISAPIRLVTLLVAMPIRALSGYILGQVTPPATCSLLAAYSLHQNLKTIPRDTTWRKDIPEILRYLWPVAIYMGLSTLFATISATVYRQRLPEIESAAYYVLSRFAEIAGYIGASMSIILIPLASEAHEKGEDNPKLLYHTLGGTAITTCLLAIAFAVLGKSLLNLSEVWRQYSEYAYLLPWMAILTGSSIFIATIVTYEMACRRFKMVAFIVTVNLFWTIFLVSFTGYEYFRGILPEVLVDWIKALHIARLSILTYLNIILNTVQITTFLFLKWVSRK